MTASPGAAIPSPPGDGLYNFTKAAAAASETLQLELSPHGMSGGLSSFFGTNLLDQFPSPDARQRILAEKDV